MKLYEEPLPWLTFTPPEKDRLAAKSIYCRALFSLERKQEALQVANEGISEASSEHWAFVIATFFEVRGRLTEESHPRQSEQDLANSIALYLASGAVNRAEELSTKFMPEFSENKDIKSL